MRSSGLAFRHIKMNFYICLNTDSNFASSLTFSSYLNICMAYFSSYSSIRVNDFDNGRFFTTNISSSSFDIPKKFVLFLKTFLKNSFPSNSITFFMISLGVSSILKFPSSLAGERKSSDLSLYYGLNLSAKINFSLLSLFAFFSSNSPICRVP